MRTACLLALLCLSMGCDGDPMVAPDAGVAPPDAAIDAGPGAVGDAGGADAGSTPLSGCGDGEVEAPELCDLGADNGGDDCAWDCTPAAPFNAYDDVIESLIARYEIPGGAVAVMYRGRLVLVRGYGVMDLDGTPTDPLARFRIASVSKPITSAAIMQLVQEDRLGLADRVFVDHLADLVPAEGTPERADVDPRLFDVTVEQLLHHAGGWDREVSYDPMFIPDMVSAELGVDSPPSPDDIARFMSRQPLDFTPGERYAYSNFGYSLLGRVIERVTGADYETHVVDHLLGPLGITSMAIGASRLDRVADDESYYFPTTTGGTTRSVFDEDGNPRVPTPYGGWSQSSLDAHGGSISNTVDLLRFSGAVDGFDTRPDVLDAASLATYTQRPAVWPAADSPSYYYAMGWSVRVVSATAQNRWHNGSLPGTATILVRTSGELTWVALYNRRSPDDAWWGDMDAAMWEAQGTVTAWPDYDLFDRF